MAKSIFDKFEGSEAKAVELRTTLSQQETADELNKLYNTDAFKKYHVNKLDKRSGNTGGKKPGPAPKTYQEKAEQADINTLLAKKSLYDHIGDSFVKAIQALPAPDYPEPVVLRGGRDEEEIFVIFSDSQIGSLVNPKETGGLGSYSTAIFQERLDYFKKSLASIFALHKNVPVNRINVLFLGDIIEGSTIFKGQLRSIDQTTVNQIMISVDALSSFVSWLSTQFPEVGCYCVVGNHGRIGFKGELSPMDNLDYLVYKWMEERLALHENVKVNVAETWWMVVERMNTRFTLVHGDDVRSWMSIPFYGAERSEARMQRLLNVAFDYYVIGHHHVDAKFGNIIMNGNWVGGSEFSLKVFQVGGLPTQKVFGLHPNHGITWSRDVKLVDPSTLKPTRIYK